MLQFFQWSLRINLTSDVLIVYYILTQSMLLCMYLFTIFLSTCLDKLGSELTSEGATSLGFICNVCIILSQNLKMMLATCVITMNCHCSQAYFSLVGPPYFFWSRQSPCPCWGSVQCLYYTRTGGWRSVRRTPSCPAWSSPSPWGRYPGKWDDLGVLWSKQLLLG